MESSSSPTLQKKKIPTMQQRALLLDGEQHLLVERPQLNVSVITLNRPELKNVMTHRTRAQLFNQLQVNDQDPDVRVTIIKGAGGNFCAGHDFDSNRDEILPFFEPDFDGQTSRHVLNQWLMMNDLNKPIIAQVDGEAIGGGLELAAACDVCICAEDSTIGYGTVRGQGISDYQILPWMCGMRNAMELVLTNHQMTGIEAHKRRFATEVVPKQELDHVTMDFALRVAKIPADLLAFNKKSVHRAFEAQGMRTNLRNGVDLEQLMFKSSGAKMLTARRGSQKNVPVATRVPPPRPGASAPARAAVATQGVSATEKPAAAVVAASVEKTAAAAIVAVPAPTTSRTTGPAKTISAAATAAPVASAASPAKSAVVGKSVATPVKSAVAKPAAVATKAPVANPIRTATATPVEAAVATPTEAMVATPVKLVAARPVMATKAATPVKVATPSSVQKIEGNSVEIHLHEAVHIHMSKM